MQDRDAGRGRNSLVALLLGRRVANREAESLRLGVLSGIPAMGLDGLGSASYGPEAALAILAGTGAAGLAAIGPITGAILAPGPRCGRGAPRRRSGLGRTECRDLDLGHLRPPAGH